MDYQKITRSDLKKLEKTTLGGADGTLYLEPSHERVLKLFHRFLSNRITEGKKEIIEQLLEMPELEEIAALPKELVSVPAYKRSGYWMRYCKNGVELDTWTKQNKNNREKVLEMYKNISKILMQLHLDYGIIISDCNYNNILIIDDRFPVLVDVDSWSIDGSDTFSSSRILYDYTVRMRWNRYSQSRYLDSSMNGDKAALWLMYFESVLDLPVRKKTLKLFPDIVEKSDEPMIIKEIAKGISDFELNGVPYLHEVAKQYKLYK